MSQTHGSCSCAPRSHKGHRGLLSTSGSRLIPLRKSSRGLPRRRLAEIVSFIAAHLHNPSSAGPPCPRRCSDQALLALLVAFDTTSHRSNREIADFICDCLDRPGVRITRHATAEQAKLNLIVAAGPEDGDRGQGMLEFYFEWNWPAAEREFQRAVALNPNDQHAHHMYANYLVAMGRIDEAVAERTRALELDPLSIRTGLMLGRDYFIARQYDRSAEQYRRTAEIDSTSPLALGTGQEGSFGLGDVYERLGRPAEAVAEYLKAARLEGVPAGDIEQLRQAFAASGLPGYWRQRLELELRARAPAPDPLRIASLWARIGDAEQTAEWLERAYEERSMALPFLGVLPMYERVRSHPRIVAILERMKLNGVAETGARR